MDSVLNKAIVLKLNANWERLGYTTPKKAFIDMCGGEYGGTPPALALDITLDENGQLANATPTKWEDWVGLPVRECDLSVSLRSGAIRCPLVIIAPKYAKMPLITPALTRKAILERDGHRCQYTDEVLPASELNIDHVIPKDKGGKNTWENLVTSRRDINFKKGNKSNDEAGLSLKRKPKAPKAMPKSFLVKQAYRPEHVPFIKM